MRGPWPLRWTGSAQRPGRSRTLGAGGLLLRFTAAGVVVLGALAGLIALLARQTGIEQAKDRVAEATYLMSQAVVEPNLTPAVVRGDPRALESFSAALEGFAPEGSLVRFKLWDAEGRVVYSDEPRLIGEAYELGADELVALREQRSVQPEVSDLELPENQFEAGFGRLLEVYVGVRSTDGEPLLFETYFLYDAVADAGLETWQRFAPPALGALVVLEIVQIPFAWSLARRLDRQQRERERLLRYAVESSDAERRRIAGDLHDGVIQDLTGLTLAMDATRLGETTDQERTRLLGEGAVRLRRSIVELRTLMVDLYPPDIGATGLDAALRELAANLEHHGIAVDLDLHRVDDLGPDLTALLFRVAQESIRNVIGHSEARAVTIRAASRRGVVTLEVGDDGRGFDDEDLQRRSRDGHFGLRTLGDLVADSGGALTVSSAPAAGTQVRVEVPTS